MVIQVAQTLDRSVISNVLYRLSYTTGKRYMLPSPIRIRPLRKEHQMPHAHSLHHAPAHYLALLHSLCFTFTPTLNSVVTYRQSITVPCFGLLTVYSDRSAPRYTHESQQSTA